MSLHAVVGWIVLSQIISYGTIFYSYAIIAPGFAAEFTLPPTLPFTVISIALLISGLMSPILGRQIDRRGAPRIMVLGSLAVGIVYALAGHGALRSWPGSSSCCRSLPLPSSMVLHFRPMPNLAARAPAGRSIS
jgi:MFS family permease